MRIGTNDSCCFKSHFIDALNIISSLRLLTYKTLRRRTGRSTRVNCFSLEWPRPYTVADICSTVYVSARKWLWTFISSVRNFVFSAIVPFDMSSSEKLCEKQFTRIAEQTFGSNSATSICGRKNRHIESDIYHIYNIPRSIEQLRTGHDHFGGSIDGCIMHKSENELILGLLNRGPDFWIFFIFSIVL